MNDTARVGPNKVVSITYRILDEDGTLLEQVDLPVSYVHGGRSNLIEKVERALDGHAVGDEVEVTLTPTEGFGEHDPSLTYTDDLENVPEQFRKVGAQVEMQNDRGEVKTFVVSRIENGKLTVDGNHPLAGKHLKFILKIDAVRDATEEELRDGVAPMTTVH